MDAFLESCVRKLRLQIRTNDNSNTNNNNINFKGLSTNTSIKELDIDGSKMSQQDRMNLYDVMKPNKTVEKLKIYFLHGHVLEETEKNSFKGMFFENITFTNVTLTTYEGTQQDLGAAYNVLKEESVIHTALNRKWKRYTIMMLEVKTAATAAAAVTAKTGTATTIIAAPPLTLVAEEQKRFFLRVVLHAFKKKPILRDAIIFSLLTKYYDVFDNDSNKENNSLYRMLYKLQGEEEKSMHGYVNYNSRHVFIWY